MDNNKKFIAPTMEVVKYYFGNILTVSGTGKGKENWQEDDNWENW